MHNHSRCYRRLLFAYLLFGAVPTITSSPTASEEIDIAGDKFDDNDDLFDGRYLSEDDDRHNDSPNEKESSNGPIAGFTSSVSNKKDTCRHHGNSAMHFDSTPIGR